MTDWCGGSGQVKWLTDVVAGGKSNDWLMWWYSNVLCLALALALSLVLALALALVLALTDDVVAGGQVKWLTDVVAGGKSNDWLMQWYSNALCLVLALALALALALEIRATWRNFRYLIFVFLFSRSKSTDTNIANFVYFVNSSSSSEHIFGHIWILGTFYSTHFVYWKMVAYTSECYTSFTYFNSLCGLCLEPFLRWMDFKTSE